MKVEPRLALEPSELDPEVEMKMETMLAPELPSELDQELGLTPEQDPKLEQPLPEAAPRLLHLPSRTRPLAFHEPSWPASQPSPPVYLKTMLLSSP